MTNLKFCYCNVFLKSYWINNVKNALFLGNVCQVYWVDLAIKKKTSKWEEKYKILEIYFFIHLQKSEGVEIRTAKWRTI